MKILHTADWHIDQLHEWGKKGAFTEYHISVLEDLVNKAIEEKVDIFVFAGDLYKNVSSNYKTKDKVNTIIISFINRLNKAGIEVIFISGNHDIKIKNTASLDNNLSLFGSLIYDKLYVNSEDSNTISYRDYKDLRVILLPYLKDRDKEEVRKELKSYIDEVNGNAIIIGHIDVFGALYGTIEIQGLDLKSSTVWDPEELEELGAKKVLLGHIHNHQRLGSNKSVIYSGSPYKLTFNEETSKKGYYIHDIKKNTSEFYELNDKKWKTFRYDYKAKGNFTELLEEIKAEELENSVCRIILSNLTPDDYKYIPYKEITDILTDKNIYLFRGYQYKNIGKAFKKEKDREYGGDISLEKLDPKTILENTLEKDGMNEEYRKKADTMLNNIIDELAVAG